MSTTLLTRSLCINCGRPLGAGNKGREHRYRCVNPAEAPVEGGRVDPEVVLQAASAHFITSRKIITGKEKSSQLTHQRRVVIHLLMIDSRVDDYKISALFNRTPAIVTSATDAVARNISRYSSDIKAIRSRYQRR